MVCVLTPTVIWVVSGVSGWDAHCVLTIVGGDRSLCFESVCVCVRVRLYRTRECPWSLGRLLADLAVA